MCCAEAQLVHWGETEKVRRKWVKHLASPPNVENTQNVQLALMFTLILIHCIDFLIYV